MPRRSSGGRSAPRAASRPRTPPPAPASRAPPPAPAPASGGGSMLGGGGLGSTIVQAMTWGAASSVGHRAVDAVMGPRTIQHETVVSEPVNAGAAPLSNDACGMHSKAFQDCLNTSGSDISKCQFYLDMLNDCKRNSGSAMGAY